MNWFLQLVGWRRAAESRPLAEASRWALAVLVIIGLSVYVLLGRLF